MYAVVVPNLIWKHFFHNCWHMLLPWQHTLHYCKKKCVLHIYTSRPTSVPTFIWNALFSPIFGIMCRYHGNTLSLLKMCLAHLHFKTKVCAKINLKTPFPTSFGIICRYHGNAHSTTVKKCVLHIYTSRPKCVPKLIWKHLFPQVLA